MNKLTLITLTAGLFYGCVVQKEKAEPITENSPSRSNYFDWINSEWPGSNQDKVMANLDFFEWMHTNYGMQLDIYHIDAGNIDRSPSWIPEAASYEEGLKLCYGHVDDSYVRSKFPEAFAPIVAKAGRIGTRMGIWLGPDGYGSSPEEAEKRRNMLVNFCRDYNFGLFKFDNACTDLNPENEDEFIKTMELCRTHTPDLIALNHRITLSDSAAKHMTTWLWEGKETYIDVHIWNETPAPHHRAGALSRGLPPGLSRLTEDHGVCISSCLDYWEDDLILQAFNRNLILAPEIYGSPWLLRDDEFSKLARIYNLHKKYNDILVDGLILPEEQYGLYAVSRGNDETRLITLRNLSWNTRSYSLNLNSETGILNGDKLLVKQLHPTEKVLGVYERGKSAEVKVEPFRAALIMVTASTGEDFSVEGTDYRVVKEVDGEPLEIELLAYPGETKAIKLIAGHYNFRSAVIDGVPADFTESGNEMEVKFEGTPLKKSYHRKLVSLEQSAIPEDADALYDATCFAADNNALEVRSLKRSGQSEIAEVTRARELFFSDSTFWKKGIWDKYAFDNNPETYYKVRNYRLKNVQVKPGAFRLNFGERIALEKVVLKNVVDTFHVPVAEVSGNLESWKTVEIIREHGDLIIDLKSVQEVQYIKIKKTPLSIQEVEIFANGEKLNPADGWQISNLFPSCDEVSVKQCWKGEFMLDEATANSYLCIAVPGNYGNEGAYAALKIDGRYIGAPDRSPSYASNHWEHVVHAADGNYTYYFPVDESMMNRKIEAYVFGYSNTPVEVPEVWITAYPRPFISKKLILEQ